MKILFLVFWLLVGCSTVPNKYIEYPEKETFFDNVDGQNLYIMNPNKEGKAKYEEEK